MEDFYIDYADMDDIQRAYINRRTDRHMVVTGTAGSGKSVIALHKLRQVSTQGTYAIIVYTKSLKKYFSKFMFLRLFCKFNEILIDIS